MKKLIGIMTVLWLSTIQNEILGLVVMSILVTAGLILFLRYCEKRGE